MMLLGKLKNNKYLARFVRFIPVFILWILASATITMFRHGNVIEGVEATSFVFAFAYLFFKVGLTFSKAKSEDGLLIQFFAVAPLLFVAYLISLFVALVIFGILGSDYCNESSFIYSKEQCAIQTVEEKFDNGILDYLNNYN